MSDQYILGEDGKTPEPCEDLLTWGRWMDKADRHVALDYNVGPQKLTVSTVFLGLDHSFSMRSGPILFETMVFHPDTGGREYYCDRYSTWEEAEAGHREVIFKVLIGEIARDETTEPSLGGE